VNPAPNPVETQAPYPGLRAFLTDEAELFFGRDAQIDNVLGRLKDQRFLGVVGGSGCGKSSLVRAGVVPALEAGAMGELGSDWRVADFTPGDTPLANLAGALLQSGVLGDRWPATEAGRAQLTAALRRSDRALINLVRPLELPRFTHLLLLVDQFEEIFRFQQHAANEAQLFVRLLLTTCRELQLPVYVLLTMRSDFLGQCPVFEGLPEALNDSQYLCPRMTREQIAEAIEGPAELRGATVDPALVTRLINDSGVNSDQLPLVQHVLARIWRAAQTREGTPSPSQLTVDDYRCVGGLREGSRGTSGNASGSLSGNAFSRHCDEAYLQLNDGTAASRDLGLGHQPSRRQMLAQRLFCGLAEVGEAGQVIRRPRSVAELAQFSGCPVEEVCAVADAFRQHGRTFLRCPTKTPSQPLGPADVLDVTHEALLRQWERLAGRPATTEGEIPVEGWLTREEFARRRYRRLAEAAEGEATNGLLKDPELGFLDQWWRKFAPNAAWGNAIVADSFARTGNFLERSRVAAAAEAERQAAQRRTQQELEKERAAAHKLRRYTLVSLTFAAVASLCAAWAGWWYWKATVAQEAAVSLAKEAQEKELEAQESASRATKAEELATKAKEAAEGDRDLAQQQQRRAEGLVYVNTIANAQRAWSDGNAKLAWQYLDSAQWNLRGWEHNYLYTLFQHEKTTFHKYSAPVLSATYSPDGTRIVSGSNDNSLKVRDAAMGQETLTLTGHEGPVNSVAYSPDAKRIVSGSSDKTLKVWDAATGQKTLTLTGHEGPVNSVAYSPDGTRIVSGSWDNTLKVWDAVTGQERLTLTGHRDQVLSVDYSPDATRIVSGSSDMMLQVWDAATGQPTLTLTGHTKPVSSVAFSPDGKRIVSGSWDNTLKVWDAVTGQERLTLTGHRDQVLSVDYSPDGKWIISGSDDNNLKVWDAATGQETLTLMGHKASVTSVAYRPDGNRIVSGSDDNTLMVWDLATRKQTPTLAGHKATVTSVAYSPDGKRIVSGSADKTLKVWDATTGQETLKLTGHTDWVTSVAYSPDGKRIVSGSADNTLRFWDETTGMTMLDPMLHDAQVTSVAYSPDGKRIVSGSADNTLRFWDATTGMTLLQPMLHDAQVTSVAYSPDGKRIVDGSYDNTLGVWDTATVQPTLKLSGHVRSVLSVAYSPGGTQIVSASRDNTLKVWDAVTGQVTLTLTGHTAPVFSVAYSPDGKRIVSGSADNTVKVWDAATGQETLTLTGHTGAVNSVAYSPDGKRIVSGSDDKTLKVWDATTASPVQPPPIP